MIDRGPIRPSTGVAMGLDDKTINDDEDAVMELRMMHKVHRLHTFDLATPALSAYEEDLVRHVADVNDRGEELTSAGVMRLAKRRQDEPQRARNSTVTEPADEDDPTTNGEDAAVAGVVAITEGGHSIVGVPTEMQSLADAMFEPGGVANAGEATDTETRGPGSSRG
jgi:hypothetical protein